MPFSVDYEILNGKHCGGDTIRKWLDNSDAGYGKGTDLDACKTTCSDHVECKGFIHRTSDDICAFWKKGTLKLSSNADLNCHRKIEGNIVSVVLIN